MQYLTSFPVKWCLKTTLLEIVTLPKLVMSLKLGVVLKISNITSSWSKTEACKVDLHQGQSQIRDSVAVSATELRGYYLPADDVTKVGDEKFAIKTPSSGLTKL